MTSLLPTRSAESAPGHQGEQPDAWQRLHEERRFRIEQLAALDAEDPATPRHAGVARLLATAARTALEEIDAALVRMEQGRYGVCVRCEHEIDAERLTVLPMTPLCMRCHYLEQNRQATTSSGLRRR